MGILSIVATPIGNLEDLTFRAKRILEEADFVLCEDTRVTKKLLDHYQIKTPTISYHQHSGVLKTDRLLSLLSEGKHLALVSDAGTPGISDPGGKLISAVREKFGTEVRLESIPGASALTTLLALAGAGFDRFLFLGFPPHKKGRQKMLQTVVVNPYPVALYESKHRIIKLLEELIELAVSQSVNLRVIVGRELTKMHESLYEGRPEEVRQALLESESNLKGEFVLIVSQIGKKPPEL